MIKFFNKIFKNNKDNKEDNTIISKKHVFYNLCGELLKLNYRFFYEPDNINKSPGTVITIKKDFSFRISYNNDISKYTLIVQNCNKHTVLEFLEIKEEGKLIETINSYLINI